MRAAAAFGVLVFGWACATGWGAIVHGHPLYGALLGLTVLACAFAGWRTLRPRSPRAGWRRVALLTFVAASVAWIAALAWLRPFNAVEPALTALQSDARLTVTESASEIVLTPTVATSETGVFFQPGARVDARAYAAVLRPVAEAGHVVAIAKQPLGIAFLSLGAFDEARARHPHPTRWVVGGHSLGGTVAALQADAADADPTAPAVGLFLHASYPASDLSGSLRASALSVSGSRDGFATPDDIAASAANLPAGATFVTIEGAIHAHFGDYGPQPGDGSPTISHDEARSEISGATVRFVTSLDA